MFLEAVNCCRILQSEKTVLTTTPGGAYNVSNDERASHGLTLNEADVKRAPQNKVNLNAQGLESPKKGNQTQD